MPTTPKSCPNSTEDPKAQEIKQSIINAYNSKTTHRASTSTSDTSRSSCVVIATKPVHRLQVRPIVHNQRAPHTIPEITSGSYSSVGMRRGTDRQTHRRAWLIHISRRLRLTRNVRIPWCVHCKMHGPIAIMRNVSECLYSLYRWWKVVKKALAAGLVTESWNTSIY